MVVTKDFPQADRLIQVGRVATAVAAGRHSDAEIENFLGLSSDGRQGRYYRLAAATLGLIQTNGNHATLSQLGQEFATLKTENAQLDFLARCLIDTPVFREALRFIQKHNPDQKRLRQWFRRFYPGAISTADRRFSTFVSYLRDANLLSATPMRNDLIRHHGSVAKKEVESTVALTGLDKRAYAANSPKFSKIGITQYDVDSQKLERANQVHWQLVDAKASFLQSRELEPYTNPQIDLYSNDGGQVILYEMKSIDPKSTNLLAQIRKAVAQLYEYRFIFKEPDARLSIVTNTPVMQSDAWLLEYLARDRKIAFEWTLDFESFECDADSRQILGDFAP